MKSFALQGQRGLGADFHAPCGRSFIGLLAAFRATGGTAPVAIVGQLLEEHQVGSAVSLAKLIYIGQAFGFEWRDSLWLPMSALRACATDWSMPTRCWMSQRIPIQVSSGMVHAAWDIQKRRFRSVSSA